MILNFDLQLWIMCLVLSFEKNPWRLLIVQKNDCKKHKDCQNYYTFPMLNTRFSLYSYIILFYYTIWYIILFGDIESQIPNPL